MELQGKTALITGGGHRVGRVITLELASAGANVVVNYNSSAEAARATAAEAEARGVDAIAVQANVGNAEQVTEMAAAAAERFGAVDVLVNNASTFIKDPFPTDDLTVWLKQFEPSCYTE